MKKEDVIAIVAPGPSIKNKKIVDYIKKNYSRIICVSNAFELFKKDAMCIVSSDGKWWDEYKPNLNVEKFCLSNPCKYDLKSKDVFKDVQTQTNSGCFALIVCRKIYKPKMVHLFGFDLHNRNGYHFFGEHKNLKNTDDKRFEIFKKQYFEESLNLKKEGINVLNCNNDSDLNCFNKVYMMDFYE